MWFVNRPFPSISVVLKDGSGRVVPSTGVLLRAFVANMGGEPIHETGTKSALIDGAESFSEDGRGTFDNLRIMEVSSKHHNKSYLLGVECRTYPHVKPVYSAPLRVMSKNMERRQRESPGASVSNSPGTCRTYTERACMRRRCCCCCCCCVVFGQWCALWCRLWFHFRDHVTGCAKYFFSADHRR